ncbi:DNA-binding response regulator, OmpR family, contains REC and winged-helix (wHTH) domain [Luteibacter sp. UNC138MFCol5.1]|uniref:response regulator transcription factor n=1 Tax=Luteibacter sp. UNC138MFCol5.1 TaxID=1502774 RepID=UPI0008D136DE|nr:response regulator transcription factor [Luteibacter sp. UNC138MFCol5.1]SEO98603.1 DNA-binding response regulator, OmpR family, contains REC and winged-helix (wHTH) domain [Luteibacter sp. UNC138MFCol5.1]
MSSRDPTNPPRIALVEDDLALRDGILMPGLRGYGFDCVALGSAAELDAAMDGGAFDIVILDVGLPDTNGFDLAQRLRRASRVGIVMLTGRNGSADRIRGLNDGADAYLAKPVDLGELAATLHSLLRRLRPEPSPGGGWRLDANGWCLVSPGDRRVALNEAERKVLALLMATPGAVVSRDDMAAALTGDIYDFDPHRLEVMVHRLRAKIADRSGEALPLRAVRGSGYVMLA